MYYWTPQKIKELKEKGYKLKFYNSKDLRENENNQELENNQGKDPSQRFPNPQSEE